MSIKFGGKQGKLRDAKIRDVGIYQRKFDIRDTQIMSFVKEDEGPFYPSPQEKLPQITTKTYLPKRRSNALLRWQRPIETLPIKTNHSLRRLEEKPSQNWVRIDEDPR